MFGFLIVASVKGALLLTVALVVFLLFSKSPLGALSALMILIPYSATSFFGDPVAALKGVKALHILTFFVVLIAMRNYSQSIRMPQYALIFMIVFLAMFSVSALQSLPNMDNLNLRWMSEGKAKLSTIPFILKVYARPLIMFIPFALIIGFCRNGHHVRFITNMLVLSLVILTIFILYLNLFEIKGGVAAATEYYSAVLGHRNLLANFYIIVFPFVLARYFVNKNVSNAAWVCLSIVAMGFLYSRTAYVVVPVSFILYLILSKRTKFLPLLIVIGVGLSFLVSTSVVERGSKGLESGDVDEISAGRTSNLWMPLTEEWMQNPKKLLVGDGRYAIISSDAVARGFTPETMLHPHNMYLEQILDVGIFGLIFMLGFFVFLFRKAYKGLNVVRDGEIKEYLYAAIISMASYLIAGMTGRTLFPSIKSSYFWIAVGLTIVIIRLVEQARENGRAET
jgi:hypothetical protein